MSPMKYILQSHITNTYIYTKNEYVERIQRKTHTNCTQEKDDVNSIKRRERKRLID